DVLKNIETVLKNPTAGVKYEGSLKCEPCETGVPPLDKEKIEKLLSLCPDWKLIEDSKIIREFRFKDFVESKYFVDIVAAISEEQGHHPTIMINYNRVKISLMTHASKGLTTNDFIMARIIDTIKI
ncbi:MAG: 4a-hydroxytetrahydrobiopterin dehydratase, partial [Candidatus Omnitrophica bacterium]|nr:4a-hydroxytetrahydrobiopterin dehydratase [Candidatus Omnitrophota bacterium]